MLPYLLCNQTDAYKVSVCGLVAHSKTSARFNHPSESKGKYCSKHKEPGMVDIVHPHCKVEGCTTLASFNISGQSRGEYCSQHKLVRLCGALAGITFLSF
jgi:hypothetical protein